jgi:hypothetical protein
MVSGLTAPFDPSMNLERDQNFNKRGSIWRERDVKISKSAKVNNSAIGSGSIIGDGAIVANSIIGRHCVVSPNTIVEDSILWNNVIINSHSKVFQSIIAEDNTLPSDTQLGVHTVIPHKSELSSFVTTSDNSTFTIYPINDSSPKDEDSEDESELIDIGILLVNCLLQSLFKSNRFLNLRDRQRHRLRRTLLPSTKKIISIRLQRHNHK